MNILQSFATALEMLRLHKLRAFLTMLGVIIGVMSVTIIVMISSGFQSFMTGEFQKLGADTIMIMYDNWGGNHEKVASIDGLTMDDVRLIQDRVTSVDVVAPVLQAPSQKLIRGEHDISNPRIYGSDENFAILNRVKLTSGRDLTKADVANRANVCIIGDEIVKRLFGKEEPVGKFVSFQGITLEVIGVFEHLDIMGDSNSKDLLMPITTAQDKWLGGDKLMMITTRPRPGGDVNAAMDEIWQVLMQKAGNKRIYRVDSRESILNVFGKIFGVAGAVLAAVAALSLLVGGIGIMNIMLVSVTERTKEIGLRKSIGAKRAAILTQFMVEAATLSLVGGLIGMGLAYGLGQLVTLGTAQMKWPSAGGLVMSFPLAAGIASAIFSAFIGVVFGLYPAISASRLDPIVALRHE